MAPRSTLLHALLIVCSCTLHAQQAPDILRQRWNGATHVDAPGGSLELPHGDLLTSGKVRAAKGDGIGPVPGLSAAWLLRTTSSRHHHRSAPLRH
jgi:hypothetical protein